FAGTSLLTSTIHFDGGAGEDVVDVSGLTSKHSVVADGGDGDDDIAILGQNGMGYAFADAKNIEKIEENGELVGAKLTFETPDGDVTHEFRNVETFIFTDGERSLAELFNSPPIAEDAEASGREDDVAIEVVLQGGDNEDGGNISFRLLSLPDSQAGTLYAGDPQTGGAPAQTGVEYASNTFYFVPEHDWSGEVDFDFVTVDSEGAVSMPAIATIEVVPVADAPILTLTLDLTPTAAGDEFQVNTTTENGQSSAAVAALDGGR